MRLRLQDAGCRLNHSECLLEWYSIIYVDVDGRPSVRGERVLLEARQNAEELFVGNYDLGDMSVDCNLPCVGRISTLITVLQ